MPRPTLAHPGRGPHMAGSFRLIGATGTAPTVTPPPISDTPLGVAVSSNDQTVIATLQADWDRDGYLNQFSDLWCAASSITVETSATGDLPIEAGLVEGFASSQLTAVLDGTLSDNTTHVVDALAPYRPTAALYRKALLSAPVACSIGLNTASGSSLVQQFTGQVRSIRVDSGTRSAELIAADPAELLRAPITLPSYGIGRSDVVVDRSRFGVRTQAIVDYVLRQNGIYASPPPHPLAQISCTGHGWLAAEIGRSAVPVGTLNAALDIGSDSWWVPGPFGMLAVRGKFFTNGSTINGSFANQWFSAREQLGITEGNGFGMSAWVRIGNDMNLGTGTSDQFTLYPMVDTSLTFIMGFTTAGVMYGGTNFTTFSRPIGTPTQWQYVALHFQILTGGGGTVLRFRQDGTTSSGLLATAGSASVIGPFLRANVQTQTVDWSNFQVWFDPEPPDDSAWPGETWTSQVDLIDPGLNVLTNLPDVTNADSWTVIKDAVAAEYGTVGFNSAGLFYFKSRDHATDPTSIEKTATADTSLLNLSVTSSTDSVRNIITTETTAGYMDSTTSVIVDASDAAEFDSPPGTTVWEVPLDYGVNEIRNFNMTALPHIAGVPSTNWNDTILNGYIAVKASDPSTEITSGITVYFLMAADRLGWLVVLNTTSSIVRFATIGGTSAALRVQGYRLISEAPVLGQVSDPASISVYGSRMLALSGSPYRQLESAMEPIARTILTDLSTPVPVLDQITINGDPRVSLGDTIQLVDQNTNGTILASVVKISRKLAGGQLTDTLSVRPVFPP